MTLAKLGSFFCQAWSSIFGASLSSDLSASRVPPSHADVGRHGPLRLSGNESEHITESYREFALCLPKNRVFSFSIEPWA